MLEAMVVIGRWHEPIHWHVPEDRTSVAIPDAPDLWWDVLWPRREEICGTAHTHPGGGVPTPSYEDLTTWEATESAFGRRLNWWIASSDALVICHWQGPGKLDYSRLRVSDFKPRWLDELRRLSGMAELSTTFYE